MRLWLWRLVGVVQNVREGLLSPKAGTSATGGLGRESVLFSRPSFSDSTPYMIFYCRYTLRGTRILFQFAHSIDDSALVSELCFRKCQQYDDSHRNDPTGLTQRVLRAASMRLKDTFHSIFVQHRATEYLALRTVPQSSDIDIDLLTNPHAVE